MTADERALATHPVIGAEPKRGYYFNRIHPHRCSTRSLRVEAKVLAKAMLVQGAPAKMLMFGRPRSGTTLLAHLLNQVPHMRCDGELLHDIVLFPRRYLNLLARRSGSEAYGVKLLSYQLLEVQRIRNPLRFLSELVDDGFHLIHMRRETVTQSLSLVTAQTTGRYFNDPALSKPNDARIDPQRAREQFAWNQMMLEFEDELMARLPHMRVQYEDDLEDAAVHQATIDRLMAELGCDSGPVKARMRRTGGEAGTVRVSNRDEILTLFRSLEKAA